MRLPYKTGLEFELFILDLLESMKPTTGKELEMLSDDFHSRIEVAINDHIEAHDELQDYDNQY